MHGVKHVLSERIDPAGLAAPGDLVGNAVRPAEAEGDRTLRRDWCGPLNDGSWTIIVRDKCGGTWWSPGATFAPCCRVHDWCYGKCRKYWNWYGKYSHRANCDRDKKTLHQ